MVTTLFYYPDWVYSFYVVFLNILTFDLLSKTKLLENIAKKV